MGTPEILCVSKLPPFLMSDLQDHFQIHDHEHITDPGALGRIRAIVGGGESKIDKKLLSLFPAVEMVSIFGVVIERRTLTFSSWIDWEVKFAGGSMAVMERSCIMWF